MRMNLFSFIAVVSAMCMCAFSVAPDTIGATVAKRSGVAIFVYSEPVSAYDVIGTAKVSGIVSSTEPDHMVDLLVKDAKKDFPDAQGIIISDTKNFERADVIKFK